MSGGGRDTGRKNECYRIKNIPVTVDDSDDIMLLLDIKHSFQENKILANKALLCLTRKLTHHIRFKLVTCQRCCHIAQEDPERSSVNILHNVNISDKISFKIEGWKNHFILHCPTVSHL